MRQTTWRQGLCRWLLIAMTASLSGLASALEPIVVNDGLDGLSLVGRAEFQRDPKNHQRPAQLDTGAWQPLTAADRHQGNTSDSFWLRLTLHNSGNDARHWVIVHDSSWMEYMTVFVGANADWRDEAGARLPFASRTMASPLPAVVRMIGPGETQQVFVRLSNPSKADVRMSLRLYEARRFVQAMQSYSNVQSLHFGICVTLATVWLLFAIVLRQTTFASYGAYLLAHGIGWLSLRGLWFQYAMPDFPNWTGEVNSMVMPITAGCAFLFTRQALRLQAVAPVLDKISRALMWLSAAVVALIALRLLPVDLAYPIGRSIQALTVINAIFAWVSWRRGTPHTGWMVVGWAIAGGSLIATLLLTLVSTSHEMFDAISPQSINQIAALIEMLCFTLSMTQWVRSQQQERIAAEHSANTDGLTGLNNRKCVERRLGELMALPAARGTRWLGVVDIDFFKKVNDTYGHAAGDAVLREFADILRANSRHADIVGRFGGEEFVLVLDRVDREGAERITNRLREAFEEAPTSFEGKTIPHTLSLGLADHAGETEMTPWFERADAALYEAKHGGRNRVCVASR